MDILYFIGSNISENPADDRRLPSALSPTQIQTDDVTPTSTLEIVDNRPPSFFESPTRGSFGRTPCPKEIHPGNKPDESANEPEPTNNGPTLTDSDPQSAHYPSISTDLPKTPMSSDETTHEPAQTPISADPEHSYTPPSHPKESSDEIPGANESAGGSNETSHTEARCGDEGPLIGGIVCRPAPEEDPDDMICTGDEMSDREFQKV